MDRTLVAALAVALALFAGCGEEDKPEPPVRLVIEEPADLATLREDSVSVRGHVEPPGASVRVRGEPAPVSGGDFDASVPLEPGVNVVDVMASAEGNRPAMRALRVRRQVTVKVPDLAGATPSDAVSRLEGLGLEPDVQETGDILDLVLPGDPFVCDTEPPAGTTVDPGTTVRVFSAERC